MITYEDLQEAASSISECVSNVLTVSVWCIFFLNLNKSYENSNSIEAVNAPLQQRSYALDLDVTRANDLPNDYDTDLESIWSNPSNEFSLSCVS